MSIKIYVNPSVVAPAFRVLCDELAAHQVRSDGHERRIDLHAASLRDMCASFETFCKSDELALIVNGQLRAIRSGPSTPPIANNTMLLAETDEHVLSLSIFRPQTRERTKLAVTEGLLLTQSSHALVAQVSTNALTLTRYGVHQKDDGSPPDILLGEPAHLRRGEALFVNAEAEFLDFSADADYLLVRLTSKAFVPFVWVVEAQSLSVTMTTASVPAVSRIPLALKLAARLLAEDRMGGETSLYEETIDAIKDCAAHEYHFVRWAATQALCYVDLKIAGKFLLSATNDAHPHVRRAAQRTIQMFNR